MKSNSTGGSSSRERMLAALSCTKPDHLPCSFMLFHGLRKKCRDHFDFVERQLELGLDARVDVSDLMVRFHPEVTVREWKETPPGSCFPLLHKEYVTPGGTLTASVSQTDDWPYADHIPLFDDYLAVRSQKFLVTGPDDLKALKYLLAEPDAETISEFRVRAEAAGKFARDKDLLFSGGGCNFERPDAGEIGHDLANVGIDALMWLCGSVAPLVWAYENPDFLTELISLVAGWNRKRLEITLESGVDLIVKRAWYEGTDFWSPELYRRFIAPVLAEDVRLAHQAGVKFGYIITSGMMPILDQLLEIRPDVIIGIDPVQGRGTELNAVQAAVNNRACVWGGVNGCLTMETGTPEEVTTAVENAIAVLGRNNGFILSPVDNVRELTPRSAENVHAFIETWRASI